MAKKLGLLLTAVAMLAFAAPSFAGAATGVTEGGKLVPTGKTITFTNSQPFQVTTSNFGTLTCTTGSVMLDGLLGVNSLAEVKAGAGEKTYNATCSSPSGGVVKFTNFRLNSLSTTGGGSGSYSLSFDLPLGSEGEAVCKYTSAGTFTYNPGQTAEGANTITVTKQPTTVSPPACGTTGALDGAFNLATGGTSTPVFLM